MFGFKKKVVIVPPSFGRRVQMSFSDRAPDFVADLVYRAAAGLFETVVKEGATRIFQSKALTQTGVQPINPTPPQP
jgi:hypothetical protein